MSTTSDRPGGSLNDVPADLLIAYADGELNAPEQAAERARVEAAIEANPQLASRVEQHKALRQRLSAAFDPVLDEPIPDRLRAAIRGAGAADSNASGSSTAQPASGVTDLNRARAERSAAAEVAAEHAKARGNWRWPQWGAIAASLVIGAVIGHQVLQSPAAGGFIGSRDGKLVAQAGLAEALSNQLASTQPATAPIQIGTSFKTKAGDYCRTFTVHEGETVGGIACRSGDRWNVNTLARLEASPGAVGGYRPAGSEMSAAVRAAVEEQIAGDPLDASGESQAKNSGWK